MFVSKGKVCVEVFKKGLKVFSEVSVAFVYSYARVLFYSIWLQCLHICPCIVCSPSFFLSYASIHNSSFLMFQSICYHPFYFCFLVIYVLLSILYVLSSVLFLLMYISDLAFCIQV